MREPLTLKLSICPYDLVFDRRGIDLLYHIQELARYAILSTGAKIIDTSWEYRPTVDNPLGEVMSTLYKVVFPFEVKNAGFEVQVRQDELDVKRVHPIIGLKLEFPE